jgi:hypothetical protein
VTLGSWSFGHFESPNTTHFIKDILAGIVLKSFFILHFIKQEFVILTKIVIIDRLVKCKYDYRLLL